MRENGQYMGEYLYNNRLSNKDAHMLLNDIKTDLTSYNSFFFNVPEGINYYSFKLEEDNMSDILVKIQSYEDKKSDYKKVLLLK